MFDLNIATGWCGMVAGALLGMTFGLWAESAEWAGGYAGFRRRALRLAHIAAFALGIINVLYGLCGSALANLPAPWLGQTGRVTMLLGAVLMPLVCLAVAWRRSLKYLFPIPATCLLTAVSLQAWAWLIQAGKGA